MGCQDRFLMMFIALFLSPQQSANMPTASAPAYECFRCFVLVTSANDAARAMQGAAAQNAGWPDALRLRGESGAKVLFTHSLETFA